MKKLIAGGLLTLCALCAGFAGDSAVLVDSGFSQDGNYYVFGQYGKIDKKFQGWAEIYTVDVLKNDYVDGEVFKVKPSAVTFDKTGKEVYESLAGKSFFTIKKYGCRTSEPDQILYIREEEQKTGTDVIEFKDFVSSVSSDQAYYRVNLVPEIYGSGINVKSSFYINLEKRDSRGALLASQKIGTPSITRKGVKGYKIERIVCDKSGHNLIFIVEKTMEDKTGINIRYMIEAARLNEDFFNNLAEPEEKPCEEEDEVFEESSDTDGFSSVIETADVK